MKIGNKTRRFVKILKIGLMVSVVVVSWHYIRIQLRPAIEAPTETAVAHAGNVKILRDELGVPHIFGKTDADTAFGLAYANAEDDYPTIQGSLAAARGQLALLLKNKNAVLNDYLVQLLNLPEKATEQYNGRISPDFKKILEAYADGLNFYAFHHPEDVDSRFLPFTGKDVIAGFIHKLPLFMGVAATFENLLSRKEADLEIGRPLQRIRADGNESPSWERGELAGSNAHAVSRTRSADGITRLNINSHQPYEGPVAWYEAHVVSEEGWDMIGGTFPGSPVILHGHNRYLGWAHTVNTPDAIDVYKLTMHPDGAMRYKMDGQWMDLAVRKAFIRIDTGVFNLPIPMTFYESIHGPVLKVKNGYYAIRYVGRNRAGLSVEQWYRMNKATNIDQWKNAMAMQAIPMMNTMYADCDNILYVYNHLLPIRSEKYDWLGILPGDISEAIWTDYLPFDKLPMAENPPSGYLINTNSTPFQATRGTGNPDPDHFSRTFGIETIINNRAVRSHELFGKDDAITREEFITYKFDRLYSKKSPLFTEIINPLIDNLQPENEYEKKALEILREWDGNTDETSVGATLATLIYRPIFKAELGNSSSVIAPSAIESFKTAVAFLHGHYNRVDVPLGEVQRLKRGKTDLPLGGSIDVLNAVHTREDGDKAVAVAGDSYILIVEFPKSGARSWARHQYGNVNRNESVHYDDQAAPFSKRLLKESLLTMDAIRQHIESEYHPGEESRGFERIPSK